MILVEKQIITRNNKYFKDIDELSFKAKNLYNATLYEVRQHYINNNKYLNYYDTGKLFAHNNQPDYRALPAKVSKYVQHKVDKNFKSYFALLKLKQNGQYDKPVRLPKYLDKLNGRHVVEYHKTALSLVKDGYVKLSKSNIWFKSSLNKNQIKFLRIVPKYNYYNIEIGYEKECKLNNNNSNNLAFIDPGLNNLFTVTSNCFEPQLYNGKPFKSINQYYNKKKSKIQNELKICNDKHWSHRLSDLTRKRDNLINNYVHKLTRMLVNRLVSHSISKVIVGKNVGMKQDINIGKKNNQNYVQIPMARIMNILRYKCELEGIEYIEQEESYTSRSSFIDRDEIPKYEKDKKHTFSGKRIKRGMYRNKEDYNINADVNGSLNIGRKYLLSTGIYTEELHNQLLNKINNPKVIKIRNF